MPGDIFDKYLVSTSVSIKTVSLVWQKSYNVKKQVSMTRKCHNRIPSFGTASKIQSIDIIVRHFVTSPFQTVHFKIFL